MRHLSDTTLVARARAGDHAATETLVERYRERAERIAARFFFAGGDRDDVRQEALFGILRAIRNFRVDGGSTFSAFVEMCVRRWLATCVVDSMREKRRVLTNSVRTGRDEAGRVVAVVDVLSDPCADVGRVAEGRAELSRIVELLPTLTTTERRALLGVTNGFSYAELEASFGLGFKTADNAVQRARRKLREAA